MADDNVGVGYGSASVVGYGTGVLYGELVGDVTGVGDSTRVENDASGNTTLGKDNRIT